MMFVLGIVVKFQFSIVKFPLDHINFPLPPYNLLAVVEKSSKNWLFSHQGLILAIISFSQNISLTDHFTL